MRELKFRAWDKITKRYYIVSDLAYDDDGNLCEVYLAGIQINESNPNANVRRPNEVVLEQYTWLKDKNGKEIYEGDILTIWCGKYRQRTAYEVYDMRAFYRDCEVETDVGITKCEAIGNIHENPELLEKEE